MKVEIRLGPILSFALAALTGQRHTELDRAGVRTMSGKLIGSV